VHSRDAINTIINVHIPSQFIFLLETVNRAVPTGRDPETPWCNISGLVGLD